MSGDWRGKLWTLLVTFCIVINRCIETFWSPCITNKLPVHRLYLYININTYRSQYASKFWSTKHYDTPFVLSCFKLSRYWMISSPYDNMRYGHRASVNTAMQGTAVRAEHEQPTAPQLRRERYCTGRACATLSVVKRFEQATKSSRLYYGQGKQNHGCWWRQCSSFRSSYLLIYRVIKISLCTQWLQYKNKQKSDCLAADRQGQEDTRLTLTPSGIPNSNYFVMVSDWNCLKYFLRVFVL
jgi:hypothetical protein